MTDLENGSATRQLDHAEMLYRPGERDLAVRFFRMIGCECNEFDVVGMGRFLVIRVDPSARFRQAQDERPYRNGHIGIRLPSMEALGNVLDRVRTEGETEVAGILEPPPERAASGYPVQAFVEV
jgi:hypothetical protein